MKRFKQIGSAVLAAALMLCAAIPASAAETPAVDYTRDGNSTITIFKYVVDTTDGLDLWADGQEKTGDTVIDGQSGLTLGELETLDDVGFQLTHMADDTTDMDTAQPHADGYTDIQYTAGGKLVFENLSFGVYLIEELTNPDAGSPVDPFLVTLPMTNPTGDGLIYDVFVYPKNVLAGDGPQIDKDVTKLTNKHETAGLGEDVTRIISAEIPEGIASGLKYEITDQLDERLAYAGDSELSVYYLDPADGSTPVELTQDTHFSFTSSSTGSLTFTLLDAGFSELANAFGPNYVSGTDALPKVYIQFDTTLVDLEGDIETWLATPIYNGGELNYTNSINDDFYSWVEDEPEVHTGGLRITKIDGKTDEPLAGAVFNIYPTLDDARAGTNALVNPATGAGNWTATTDNSGYAYFHGLTYGGTGDGADGGQTTYWLVEIQAPSYWENGVEKFYNLATAPIEATVDSTSHLSGNGVTVENYTGFTLPITGGTGTMLFTVLGLCLLAGGGAALLITRRKKGSQ